MGSPYHVRAHCGDHKGAVIRSLVVDSYPLPKPEDVMVGLTGGKEFSKLNHLLSVGTFQSPLERAHHFRLLFRIMSLTLLMCWTSKLTLNLLPSAISPFDHAHRLICTATYVHE